MKAIICTKYGSPEVLQLREVEKPTPKDKEVLIKIRVTSVTAADGMMRKGAPYIGRLFLGLTKPKHPITGTGFAGEIVAIGKEVTLFKKGDQVFGESILGAGTNAEFVCVPEDGILAKNPKNRTPEELASICDGPLTSLNFLKKKANIQPGQNVLIIGASGALGTSGVQLAKHFGAKVTGVCSTTNLELVKMLGADKVIDYTVADFTNNGQTYDIIYDAVGKNSFSTCKDSLTQKGVYLSPVLELPLLFQMIKTSIIGTKKAMFDATGMRPVPELRILLQELIEIMVSGNLKTVIDRRYPLAEVAEAHKYVDTGHKKGNIVINV
ncbi:MAG: NADPH:quinone reductase-like Zn-dependent oxidoreductase [Saprospiraceae bacterium]|jgi:NADPH:quinone reductase-like Zn-dependent oxidoreductase